MEYRNIYNGNYLPGPEEEMILNEAVSLMDKPADKRFLVEAALLILQHSKAEYFLIGPITPDKEHVRTLLLMKGDKRLDNITYAFRGTPCETARTYGFCFFPFNVSLIPKIRRWRN